MKLIFALGNPEANYDRTRHNVGFWLLDKFAYEKSLTWRRSTKFKADIAEGSYGGEKFLLIKPQTYYNLTGESARKLTDFYKLKDEDMLIVHDELALDIGCIRTRNGGSAAGNNGVKSISLSVGENTARLRIGIANDQRQITDDSNFVLGKLTKQDQAAIDSLYPKMQEAIEAFITGSYQPTTHKD